MNVNDIDLRPEICLLQVKLWQLQFPFITHWSVSYNLISLKLCYNIKRIWSLSCCGSYQWYLWHFTPTFLAKLNCHQHFDHIIIKGVPKKTSCLDIKNRRHKEEPKHATPQPPQISNTDTTQAHTHTHNHNHTGAMVSLFEMIQNYCTQGVIWSRIVVNFIFPVVLGFTSLRTIWLRITTTDVLDFYHYGRWWINDNNNNKKNQFYLLDLIYHWCFCVELFVVHYPGD